MPSPHHFNWSQDKAKAKISKQRAVKGRIRRFEEAIERAKKYLETGEGRRWQGFRAMFTIKAKDGAVCLPHRDWIRNVFMPRCEPALNGAERALERLEEASLP